MQAELSQLIANARKTYQAADGNGRRALESVFGDILNQKVTDRIKTFNDALAEAGRSAIDFQVLESMSPEEKVTMQLKRLKLIAEVLNEGWKANLADTKQYKYYPWFSINPNSNASGFGLSFSVFVCANAGALLGVRLYFKSSELAKYAANQFLREYELYAQFLNAE